MKQFNIKLSTLKALALLSAKKDIRHYLQGVLVEFNHSFTRTIATNGHILGIYQENCENLEEGFLIIPRDVIESISSNAKNINRLITFKNNGIDTSWSFESEPGRNVVFNPIEAKFPDYVRVTEKIKTNNLAAYYEPEYLNLFHKTIKTIGGGGFNLHFNGNEAGLITCSDPDFMGVIMPKRNESSEGSRFSQNLTSSLFTISKEVENV